TRRFRDNGVGPHSDVGEVPKKRCLLPTHGQLYRFAPASPSPRPAGAPPPTPRPNSRTWQAIRSRSAGPNGLNGSAITSPQMPMHARAHFRPIRYAEPYEPTE